MTQKENTIGDQNIPISTDIIYGGLLPILVKDSMRLHSSSPFSQIIPGPPHRYLPMVASIFLETLFIAWIFSNLKLTYCAMILMNLKLIACIVDKCIFFAVGENYSAPLILRAALISGFYRETKNTL